MKVIIQCCASKRDRPWRWQGLPVRFVAQPDARAHAERVSRIQARLGAGAQEASDSQ